MTRADRIAALKAAAKERILILDGSWGVMIQRRGLDEADFRGDRFKDHPGQLKGNNDILCLTRPDIIDDLHDQYFAAGADISETNTFSATVIAQDDYHLDAQAVSRHQSRGRADRAAKAADAWTAKEPDKPRFVAGSIGPLNKMLSMSSDVNDPGARLVDFRSGLSAPIASRFRRSTRAASTSILIETITDTLNCQGGDQGDHGSRGRGTGAPADLDFRHHHRPLRPHALRPDGRSVLEFGEARQALRHRLQLRARAPT